MRGALGRILTSLIAVSLLVAACGDDDATSTGDTSTSSTTAEDTTTSSTTTETTSPGDLPGERVDIFPYEDAELGVVGVDADDTLNVRSGPGVEFDVVAELEPLATGVIATGHNRSLDDSFWVEVEVDGETGWANVSFLSQLGQVEDITTEIAPTPPERPGAETMLDLGRQIAESRAGEGPPEPRIVVVDGPTVGDLGEITVDVLDFPDDAQLGERLHIFGDPGVESFTLRSVERTVLCRRGVSDGRCV